MSVPAALAGVALVWSTTPLAIAWSGAAGAWFAVSGRMAVGLVVCALILWGWGHRPPLDRRAWPAYLACGLGIFGSMGLSYWGARFVPSGWIAVIFGLSPLVTAILAARFLDEGRVGARQWAGMALGVAGLAVLAGKGWAPMPGWGCWPSWGRCGCMPAARCGSSAWRRCLHPCRWWAAVWPCPCPCSCSPGGSPARACRIRTGAPWRPWSIWGCSVRCWVSSSTTTPSPGSAPSPWPC